MRTNSSRAKRSAVANSLAHSFPVTLTAAAIRAANTLEDEFDVALDPIPFDPVPRRRKRKDAANPADRISGGWDELVDRASDYGTRVPPGATRAEDAALMATAMADPAVTTLAVRADGQVFGPAEPSPAEVDEFWRQVDEIVAGLGERASVWRRLRARLSLRSYLADARLSKAVRQAARSVVDSARTAGAQAVRSVVGSGRGDGPGVRMKRGTQSPDRGRSRDEEKGTQNPDRGHSRDEEKEVGA